MEVQGMPLFSEEEASDVLVALSAATSMANTFRCDYAVLQDLRVEALSDVEGNVLEIIRWRGR